MRVNLPHVAVRIQGSTCWFLPEGVDNRLYADRTLRGNVCSCACCLLYAPQVSSDHTSWLLLYCISPPSLCSYALIYIVLNQQCLLPLRLSDLDVLQGMRGTVAGLQGVSAPHECFPSHLQADSRCSVRYGAYVRLQQPCLNHAATHSCVADCPQWCFLLLSYLSRLGHDGYYQTPARTLSSISAEPARHQNTDGRQYRETTLTLPV